MALLDDTGAVVEQYQWEPYGSLATLNTTVSPRPDNSVGHQGLFFCRFNPQTGDTLSLNALGLYYNRNRWYSPALGRFTSRDPDSTGLSVSQTATCGGHALVASQCALDPRWYYGDGIDLYTAMRGNPVTSADPMGLFTYADITGSISTGAQLYSYYQTGISVIGKIRDFASGASLQSVLFDAALEIGMNYAGGKLLDKLVDVAGPLMNKVGRQVVNRLKRNVLDKHHILPKFLGGDPDGILVGLAPGLHQRLHAKLREALAAKGLQVSWPGSASQWEKLLNTDKNRDTAMQVLMDVYKKFDEEMGGNLLVESLLMALAR